MKVREASQSVIPMIQRKERGCDPFDEKSGLRTVRLLLPALKDDERSKVISFAKLHDAYALRRAA